MNNLSTEQGVSGAFLDHLDKLARSNDGAWWRDVLLRDDLFLAIRRNSLNIYYRGASLFRVDDRGDGVASPKTHVKYLVRQQQVLAELVNGKFVSPEVSWTSYASPETLRDMIRAASDLAGVEKAGLHPLIVSNDHVIDVEVSLERVNTPSAVESAQADYLSGDATNTPSTDRKQDRIDVVTLEQQGAEIAIVFHEAKHFTNPALRSPRAEPDVLEQLHRYRRTIAHHAPSLLARYYAACCAFVRLDTTRRHVRAQSGRAMQSINPAIHEIASGKAKLTIDPNPRLVIFGFDADQKRGLLKSTLDALKRTEPDLSIYAVGNPSAATGAFRPPAEQKRDKKATPTFSS